MKEPIMWGSWLGFITPPSLWFQHFIVALVAVGVFWPVWWGFNSNLSEEKRKVAMINCFQGLIVGAGGGIGLIIGIKLINYIMINQGAI